MFKLPVKLAASLFLLASLLASTAALAHAQTTLEWITLAPANEGFSVQLPVKPEEQTDRVAMEGSNYKTRLYTSVDGSRILYMAIMQEFPKIEKLTSAKKLETFVDGFKEGLTKSAGSKVELLPDRDLDLKGHFGRQYRLTYGEHHGFVRVFDGDLRMYVLLIIGVDEQNSSVARFFDSFEIKPAPVPVAEPITETKP